MAITVYATTTDLQNVGLPPGALSGVSPAAIAEALQNASSMMDSYFQSQFRLPFQSISADLTQQCCLIAAKLIMRTKGFDPSDPTDRAVEDGYREAMTWCRGVADRELHPACVDSGTPANIAPAPQAYRLRSPWDVVGG